MARVLRLPSDRIANASVAISPDGLNSCTALATVVGVWVEFSMMWRLAVNANRNHQRRSF